MIKKDILERLYGADRIELEYQRYNSLAEGMSPQAGFPAEFAPAAGTLRLFSAPGRTELGGNHTDHNRGMVLAAAIQMDAVAVAAPRSDQTVFLRSAGFPDVIVKLDDAAGSPDISPHPEEQGSTAALIRGIAAAFADRGVRVGGFSANAASTVLPGSGLSSSAAVEVLIAKIFDSLYGGGQCSALELAQMGQQAENVFFGKPSGLMDQAASAFGGTVALDFADPARPSVTPLIFDPSAAGYSLCVVNTRGSHADLTPDYAAIPQEMNAVARHFGKSFLREVELSQVLAAVTELRASAGDRALLRAIHFCNENRRVAAMTVLLQKWTIATASEQPSVFGQFLDLVNESGDSSGELLQNLHSPHNPREQGLPLALAVSREFFRQQRIKAACRVHGGGFAGTIQAYIPTATLPDYRTRMDTLFGPGSLTVLRIRPVGAVEVGITE
jgi:galactokinase